MKQSKKLKDLLPTEATQKQVGAKLKRERVPKKKEDPSIREDKYTAEILRRRFNRYKEDCIDLTDLKKTSGLNIRNQNPPEDITENIAKFIIHNYDNDPSCKWSKGIGLKGDLFSSKYPESPPEVKAFTSVGPSQFGPKKVFGVLYFLDLRKWIEDQIVLWRVNLTNKSPEIKGIKINKTQTHEEQCAEGRRPRISWDKLYPQISDHCEKIFEGTFEDIFVKPLPIV